MARRSDHTREELKELIINTSWKIIDENGFEGLTARNIAKEIGYAPGTIYNLFGSLDDLYLELNGRTLDLLYDVLSAPACADPKKTPIHNMKTMALHYMNFAKDHRPHWLMLFNLRVTQNRSDAQWYHEKVEKLFDPLSYLLESFFDEGEAKEKQLAARVLWSSVHGLCFLQETGKMSVVSNDKAASKMADYLIDTFMAGVEK